MAPVQNMLQPTITEAGILCGGGVFTVCVIAAPNER